MSKLDTAALAQRIFVRIVADANLPMGAPGFDEKVANLVTKSMKMADIYSQTSWPSTGDSKPKR